MANLLSDFYILAYTWIHGDFVGQDIFGNRYYRSKGASSHGKRERRWVLYKKSDEASHVPPEWHGWLHYSMDEALSSSSIHHKSWQKKHIPNATGTAHAYYPPGHVLEGQNRSRATGDYVPWTPET